MKLFERKSRAQRLGDNVIDWLNPSGGNFSRSRMDSAGKSLKGAFPSGGNFSRSRMDSAGKALKSALPSQDKAVKAGLAAGGLAALTAASAGISAHRRREEGARDDS